MLAYEESFESSGHLSPSLPPPGCNACPTQLIYTPLHLYSTTRVAKRTTYFAREHNTMTQPEIAPQTSEAESTPQPLGHLASQEQEEQIITPDLFVLWINTGSSSFKVAVNIFCITGASFVGIYPVLTWREIENKNENKGKERKKKRNDSCHFCLLAGFDSCLTCFARAEGWSPQKWIVFIINVIKDYPHNNGSLSKKPLAMLTRTVR